MNKTDPLSLVEKNATRAGSSLSRQDSTEQTEVKTPLNLEEYKAFATPGPAFVTGHAFFLRPNNTFLICCYASVLAFPDTPYIREIVSIFRAGRSPGISPFLQRNAPRVDLHTLCDHHGNFHFENLQAYRYFFAACVHWMEDGQHQSGTLLSSTTLKSGDNSLFLTNVAPT